MENKSNSISHIIKGLKDIKQEENLTKPNCEFCGKSTKITRWNKNFHHINIAQKPEKRFFCSRQCKLNWIFKNF